MRSRSYDAAELAPWDPWNGGDGPRAAEPERIDIAHARAKARLARCRVALVSARMALDRPGTKDGAPSAELLSRLETARLLFLGAERTVADVERLLASPPADSDAAGYPPSGA